MLPRLIQPREGVIIQEEHINNSSSNRTTAGVGIGAIGVGVGDPCLVLTSDPKPRLRWTADLHDRFVDAVAQLGGPTS